MALVLSTELRRRLRRVGDNLRHYRGVRGLSQQELADASGVSRRMIAGLEGAQTNVSLGTLGQLAVALGLPFPALVRERAAEQEGRRSQGGGAQSGRRLWEGDHPESHAELLASTPSGSVDLWIWSLAAGRRHVAQPDAPGMQEMIHVLSGELTVAWQGQLTVLAQGESLVFPSDAPYAYHNAGGRPTRFIRNAVTEDRSGPPF